MAKGPLSASQTFVSLPKNVNGFRKYMHLTLLCSRRGPVHWLISLQNPKQWPNKVKNSLSALQNQNCLQLHPLCSWDWPLKGLTPRLATSWSAQPDYRRSFWRCQKIMMHVFYHFFFIGQLSHEAFFPPVFAISLWNVVMLHGKCVHFTYQWVVKNVKCEHFLVTRLIICFLYLHVFQWPDRNDRGYSLMLASL